ncbi:MAG: tetratricopeptide repeat protein [Planctomycetes bacterium]|nr:tetratricopeptide repeat protein [Planctomycetota bacterium]
MPTRTEPKKGDELRRAMVDADGHRRVATSAAAETIIGRNAEGRGKFMATLRAIAAVAPRPEAPAEAAAGTAAPKQVEFADAVKALMATVVAEPGAAADAALAKLVEDKQTDALRRLHDRGQAILTRAITTIIRRKIDTNAQFAGQYDELRDFQPEVATLLLAWAAEAPKDVVNPEPFRVTCVRAVRDVVPADQGADLKKAIGGLLDSAQKARNDALLLAAVCALHQYGEPRPFDSIKANVEKNLASDKPDERAQAHNTLAELYYQLRDYEQALGQYRSLLQTLDEAKMPASGSANLLYNTACCASLAKKLDDAFDLLDKAMTAGAKDLSISKTMVDSDHDLNNLRADPRFAALLEKHFAGKAK